MHRKLLFAVLLASLATGCASVTRTEVSTDFDPSKVPHRVVADQAEGADSGFRLLGFIPVTYATQEEALLDIWERLGLPLDPKYVVTHCTIESAAVFWLLFSTEHVNVKARIVELKNPPPAKP